MTYLGAMKNRKKILNAFAIFEKNIKSKYPDGNVINYLKDLSSFIDHLIDFKYYDTVIPSGEYRPYLKTLTESMVDNFLFCATEVYYCYLLRIKKINPDSGIHRLWEEAIDSFVERNPEFIGFTEYYADNNIDNMDKIEVFNYECQEALLFILKIQSIILTSNPKFSLSRGNIEATRLSIVLNSNDYENK